MQKSDGNTGERVTAFVPGDVVFRIEKALEVLYGDGEWFMDEE